MCGICGVVSPGGDAPFPLQPMCHTLAHRGPDDAGIHREPGVGLGHRRLSIIDLDGGHQPLSNEDGTVWIVFNGEIYNYRELRAGLEGRHRFATASDTEVIVHLYEEKGERCVEELRGMFAFAVWDRRDGSLLLARDHLGQKPLFYTHDPGRLAFASEIKALLALDPALQELNPQALHQYLSLRLIAPPLTMFQRIYKLPPAHILRYREGRVQVRRYWDLHYEPKHLMDEEELLDALEERLLETVRAHLVSDVPVGAFLSGGLDSSLVVAMMSRVADRPVKTFSVGVPYEGYSELPYARMVADRYGTEHFQEVIDISLLETLPDVVWHLDEPADPLSVCIYYIADMARRHVKVVLGGDGGDELFGGYDRYYGNRYVGYYARLPALLRRHLLGPLLERMPDGFWYKSLSHQLKWIHQLSFYQGGRRYARSLNYFYFTDPYRDALYGPRLQEALDGFDPLASIEHPYQRAHAVDPLDRMLYADSMVRLPDHPVMILDRMTMAHGLEARSPFLDHRLAEFAARIPARMKVRGRRLRYIQVRLAERYLPPELLRRDKQGFSSALPYLLADEFRTLFNTFLRRSHLARDGYLQVQPIRRMLQEHLAGQVDHGNRLWLLCNAEVWYRMKVEGWSRDEVRAALTQPESPVARERSARVPA